MHAHTALTTAADSNEAAREIISGVRSAFDGADPHALIVFVSAQHEYERLLGSLREAFPRTCLVGSSSAGEFNGVERSEGAVSVLALHCEDARFSVGIGRDLAASPARAAAAVSATFAGIGSADYPHKAALVMTDALAGFSDALVEELTLATRGEYSFFGGGAGDDGRFLSTHVFAGGEALRNAVVALEILSSKPIGIGVAHGWEPASPPLRVTEVEGARIISLNGRPAADVFEEHARGNGRSFDRSDPLPFLLHNILGIATSGGYRLRVPLSVDEQGAVHCAAEVPNGAIVHIMRTSEASALQAAHDATHSALAALGGAEPAVGIVFDCVATRLRLGEAFDRELRACADLLQPAVFAGCNTYGQIARAEGQFEGFHNCTAVVCVLPR